MELIPGVKKEEYSGYVLYHIESLSAELKGEIRNHLVSVCHGTDQSKSSSKIYSYKATVKEFIRRYNTRKGSTEDRKKGMIGELLIHIILEIEGRFSVASPFFNMEEPKRTPSAGRIPLSRGSSRRSAPSGGRVSPTCMKRSSTRSSDSRFRPRRRRPSGGG